MLRRLWDRLDRASRIALLIGLAAAVAIIPLQFWIAFVIALGAAVLLGYTFPAASTRVGVLVALPILALAYLSAFVRGFSTTTLLVLLVPSFILPVYLARIGAGARTGVS